MNNFKTNQQKHYKEMIEREDIDKRRKTRNHLRKIEAINSYLDIQPGEKVLEVGVGTGIQAEYLLEQNTGKQFTFEGIDLSEDMLKLTREKLSRFDQRINIQPMDAENLDYKDNSIDKIFVGSTIHHLPNPEKGVKEMIRVLKPGGKFCIMEPNYIHPKNTYFCHKHFDAEKNMQFMKRKFFNSWLSNLPIEYKIQNFVYTPNKPRFFVPVYNLIEMIVSRIPLLNQMSIMLFVHGTKKA